jgi:hypothetical protein
LEEVGEGRGDIAATNQSLKLKLEIALQKELQTRSLSSLASLLAKFMHN